MKNKLLIVLSMALTICSSCSYRIIDYTLLSSKNTNMTVPEKSRSAVRVVGEHSSYNVLGIPFSRADMKEATDRAIERAGPGFDSLIDGVVTYKVKWFVLFTKLTYEVEGTAVKSDQINKSLLIDSYE